MSLTSPELKIELFKSMVNGHCERFICVPRPGCDVVFLNGSWSYCTGPNVGATFPNTQQYRNALYSAVIDNDRRYLDRLERQYVFRQSLLRQMEQLHDAENRTDGFVKD